MLTGRELTIIDNHVNPGRYVTGWVLTGSYYRKGAKYPGSVKITLSGGGWVYFPENVSLGAALDETEARGFDTTEARANLAQWIATGQGASFTLKEK